MTCQRLFAYLARPAGACIRTPRFLWGGLANHSGGLAMTRLLNQDRKLNQLSKINRLLKPVIIIYYEIGSNRKVLADVDFIQAN